MKIIINTIGHRDQRYKTIGDWVIEDNGDIEIFVSDLGDWRYNYLLALHELVESALCKDRKIPQKLVDQYDIARPDDDEPGDNSDAPYHKEHMIASAIERTMCQFMGINWNKYEEAMDDIWNDSYSNSP